MSGHIARATLERCMATTSPTGVAGQRRLAGNPRDGVTPFPGSPLDTSATVALHRQVYSRIRTLILSGQVAAGSRLPSTRALAASLNVSRNTVLAAFEQLRGEGYLEGRHGSCTYVAPAVPDELLRPRVAAWCLPGQSRAQRMLSDGGTLIASTLRTPLPSLSPGPGERHTITVGVPDLDSFPQAQWARHLAQCWRRSASGLMRYNHPAGYRPGDRRPSGYHPRGALRCRPGCHRGRLPAGPGVCRPRAARPW